MENHLRAARITGTDGLQASSTVALLIMLWNAGTMTPQTFQNIAKAVHKDMEAMRDWNRAKMVSGGGEL